MDTVVQRRPVDIVETRALPGPESEMPGGQGPGAAAPLARYTFLGIPRFYVLSIGRLPLF